MSSAVLLPSQALHDHFGCLYDGCVWHPLQKHFDCLFERLGVGDVAVLQHSVFGEELFAFATQPAVPADYVPHFLEDLAVLLCKHCIFFSEEVVVHLEQALHFLGLGCLLALTLATRLG